jgi:hypothetical protein
MVVLIVGSTESDLVHACDFQMVRTNRTLHLLLELGILDGQKRGSDKSDKHKHTVISQAIQENTGPQRNSILAFKTCYPITDFVCRL